MENDAKKITQKIIEKMDTTWIQNNRPEGRGCRNTSQTKSE